MQIIMSLRVERFTFSLFSLTYTPFVAAVSLFSNSYKPVRAYCIAYLSRICTFSTWSFWWNFCKSCAYGFSIFCSVSFHLLLLYLFSICLSLCQSNSYSWKQIKSCDVWSTVPVWCLLNQCYGVTVIIVTTMWNESLLLASLLFQSGSPLSSFAIKDNSESEIIPCTTYYNTWFQYFSQFKHELKWNFIFPFLICLLTPFQLLDFYVSWTSVF